jgi:hypothetical protein
MVIVGLITWLPSIGDKHYDDDYMFVFVGEKSLNLLSLLLHKSPFSAHYRPLEAAILYASQNLFSLSTSAYAIQGLAMIAYLASAVLIFRGMKRFGLKQKGALLASLIYVTHPIATPAILGNDSTSQLYSGLLGLLGVWLIASGSGLMSNEGLDDPQKVIRRKYIQGFLALIGALLFKETAIGYFIAAILLVLFASYKRRSKRVCTAVSLSMLIVILGGYMLVRSSMGLSETSGRYEVEFGANVPRNLAQLSTASLTPFSTVQIFLAQKHQSWLLLAGLLSGTLIVLSLVIYGLVGPDKKRTIINIFVFATFLLCAFFPGILVKHVSELYANAAVPIIAFTLALAMNKAIDRRLMGVAMTFVVAVVIFVQVQAVWSKAKLMKNNGEAAERMVGQLVNIVRAAPPETTIYLIEPATEQTVYSVYLLGAFDPITHAKRYIEHLSGRQDFSIRPFTDIKKIPKNSSSIFVELLDPRHPAKGITVAKIPS